MALEKESRTGLKWIATSLGFVTAEIERDSNLPATLMPTYASRGELINPGAPPDYASAGARAASEAGVGAGTR